MKPAWLMLVAFISGAAVMAFEILGSRVLAPEHGSSIFVWGSLIGVFMAGLAAGYYLGGWLSDHVLSIKALALMLLLPGVWMVAFPYFGFGISARVALLELGPRAGPLTACMALFFLPTVALGAVTPYIARLWVQDMARMGRGIGALYAVSTVGSIAGTLGTAFYLILEAGTRVSLQVLGGALIVASAAVLWVGTRQKYQSL